MRVISTFASLVFLGSTYLACASFSEGNTGAPPSNGGDAGDGADAAAESGSTIDGGDDATIAVPKSCAQRAGPSLLCEDFENLNVTVDWNIQEANGGSVSTVADGKRGGKVLNATIAPNTRTLQAQLERNVTWTPPLYIRFYAYLDAPLADETYHFLVVLSHVELGMLGRRAVVNEFEPLAMTAATYEPSDFDFPLQKWTCVEWHLNVGETKLWFDGTEQVNVTKAMNAATTFVAVGLGHNTATTGTSAILYDDLVVSSTPVGCD